MNAPPFHISRIKGILLLFIAFKITLVLVGAFAPFHHPHQHRQTDTMATSLRYWIRWTQDIPADKYKLLPSVLSAGDEAGYSPMEFPAINVLLAPAFSLPIYWARGLAFILIVLLHGLLTWWLYRIWKDQKLLGIQMDIPVLLCTAIGISSIYIARFMPDYTAFILAACAVGLIFKEQRWAAWPLLILAFLIKPPAIAMCSLLVLRPIKKWGKDGIALVSAAAVSIAYFKFVVPWLKTLSNAPDYFYVRLINPIDGLSQALAPVGAFGDFIFSQVFFPFLLPVIAIGFFLSSRKDKQTFGILALLLLLQIIFIFALAGKTTYIHVYYHLATTLTVAMMLRLSFDYFKRPYIQLIFIVLFITTAEKSFYKIRKYFQPSANADCEQFLTDHPALQAEWKIRSDQTIQAQTGLCMGKTQNSQVADWGVYLKDTKIPAECQLVQTGDFLQLTRCNSFDATRLGENQ